MDSPEDSPEARVRGFAFDTLYRRQESGLFVDLSERPPVVSFKRMKGAPQLPLPVRMPGLGGLQEAFARVAGQAPIRSPDAPWLSRMSALLYFSLGLLRREVLHPYNLHRGVPSARCLYSSELYLWLPEGGELAEGVYHYLPAEHALELVRPGGRAWLEAALGVALEPRSVEAVALLGVDFWRIACLYGDLGYRLCLLEAGHLAGNVQLLANVLGWESVVRYQFEDALLLELLGLPQDEESCVGAVLLGRELPEPLVDWEERARPGMLAPLQGCWESSRGLNATRQGARLLEAERASRVPRLGALRRPPPVAGPPRGEPLEERPLPSSWPPRARALEQALIERNSGRGFHGLAPAPVALPGRVLEEAMALAMSPYRGDLHTAPRARPRVRLYAVASRVEGWEPGVHEYLPERGTLALRQRGNKSPMLQRTYTAPQSVNLASHGLVWFVTADVNAAFACWGARAWRLLLLETGQVGQWLCVCASSDDLFVRASLSYSERDTEQMLGLESWGDAALYQLLLGKTRYRGFQMDMRP